MRHCPKCKLTLPEQAFAFRSKSKKTLLSYCKLCQNAYSKKHYALHFADNNKRRQDNTKRQRKQYKAVINKAKTVPCLDCGKQYEPFAMDFDHKDPSLKKFNVGDIAKCSSLVALQEEIDKCDVVCAVCHRYRTHKQRNNRV